jgi:hypothetical protein
VNTTYQSSTCNYGSDGNCSFNSSQTKSFSNGLKANLKKQRLIFYRKMILEKTEA